MLAYDFKKNRLYYVKNLKEVLVTQAHLKARDSIKTEAESDRKFTKL